MPSFYDDLKKSSCVNTYVQKSYIPITIKRKYRKKNKNANFLTEFSDIYRNYSKTRKKMTAKKSFRLKAGVHVVFVLRLVYAAVFCLVFFLNQYMSAFAGAVSVPREAHATAETAKMAAQEIIDKDQAILYRLNAEEYVEDAAMLVSDLQERVAAAEAIAKQKFQEAQELRAKAQAAYQAAEAALAKAAQDKAAAAKALAAANSASEYAKNLDEGTKLRIEDISNAVAKKLDELDSQEEEVSERQLKEVAGSALKEIEKLREETSGAIVAAYDRADQLFEFSDMMDAKADQSERIADAKLDEADLARDLSEQADEVAADAQTMYDELLSDLSEAKGEEQSARDELANLIREQNNPPGSRYFSASVNYYSWSDSQGYR